MKPIRILPNEPVTVKLEDPYADSCERYDAERAIGEYRTTDGRILALPRPAVLLLNELEPAPGEPVTICRYARERGRVREEWTVALTAQAEKSRARSEEKTESMLDVLQASIDQAEEQKRKERPVTPIRRKSPARQDDQPRLFDRGTGTHGPAPQLAPAAIAAPLPANLPRKVKYGDALQHIIHTVEAVLKAEGVQLGDAPKQDLYSTVYIDFARRSGVEYDFRDGEK